MECGLAHHGASVSRVRRWDKETREYRIGIGKISLAILGAQGIDVAHALGNVAAAVFLIKADIAHHVEFRLVVRTAFFVIAESDNITATAFNSPGKAFGHRRAEIAKRTHDAKFTDVEALDSKVRNRLREDIHRDIHLENVRAEFRDSTVGSRRGKHRHMLVVRTEP